MYCCIWAGSGSGLCFFELVWEGWIFVPTFTKNVKVGQPRPPLAKKRKERGTQTLIFV
jgi:hypothetical protein